DEILIGATTRALVAAAVDAETLPALDVKGKARSVQAWRLRRVIPGAAPFPRRLGTRLVGRQWGLPERRPGFERSVSESSSYLFAVLGAPGVGKTRLAFEFIASVESDATVLTGRCLPYGEGITYWPLREIFLSELAFGEDIRAGIVGRFDGAEDV